MEMQLMLIACIVNSGIISGQPRIPAVDPVKNLLNSIAQNDTRNSDIYHEIMKQKIAKEQEAFDAIKHGLLIAQIQNSHKRRNYFSDLKSTGENGVAIKREASSDPGLETEVQQDLQMEQAESESDPSDAQEITTGTVPPVEIETTLTTITHTAPEVTPFRSQFGPTERAPLVAIGRQQVLDIFPGKNLKDPFSQSLFANFTGLNPIRVSRRSLKKIHGFIQKRDFRAFILEMNYYVRRIPFDELIANRDLNTDGLYFRAAFYLLLRALSYKPTSYFQDFWQEHSVISVETSVTVFLFAVNLGPDVDYAFNITQNIVEGKSGLVLPRDTKTILCAGIMFDTEFDPKIRHFRAVLRDRTLLTNVKPNVTTDITPQKYNN